MEESAKVVTKINLTNETDYNRTILWSSLLQGVPPIFMVYLIPGLV